MAKRLSIAGRRSATSAFEGLIRPHFDRIYGRAYALTGNAEDAEDLVQELCLRVYSHQQEVENLDRPSAWMMRVLYRLFVDLVRSRKRSPVRLMNSDDAFRLLEESTPTEEPGPERRVEAEIRDERLQEAWQRLTDDEQLLLALHGIEGLSLAEIHEVTGLPIGTIKSRLHRSRTKLGRLLEREEKRPLFSIAR
jgi:RNA polymerase sigma-70 factor (ECF subfamily)